MASSPAVATAGGTFTVGSIRGMNRKESRVGTRKKRNPLLRNEKRLVGEVAEWPIAPVC